DRRGLAQAGELGRVEQAECSGLRMVERLLGREHRPGGYLRLAEAAHRLLGIALRAPFAHGRVDRAGIAAAGIVVREAGVREHGLLADELAPAPEQRVPDDLHE